jgi:hypothetical protein
MVTNDIRAPGNENDNPMDCMFNDDATTKKVLAVCHVGDTCVIRAKGESGNGGQYLIMKVLSVRRVKK